MPDLIAALLAPEAWPPPVAGVQLVETHISWVFLTGEFAYKIKKPVNFGFLDFSTLELREFYCREELRINRRFAPQLYLDVVPVTARDDGYAIGGPGEPVEWAVRMHQFAPGALLAEQVAAGRVPATVWHALGDDLARVHAALPSSPADDRDRVGTPGGLRDAIAQNFRQVRSYLRAAADVASLNALEDWSWAQYRTLEPLLWRRYEQGLVRECHGDLHLGNVALIDGRAVPFDALEFNASLRWIDIQSEVAFLLTDASVRGCASGGFTALNAWLERGGDHAGLALLAFYRVYRAMVRAKVALLRGRPPLLADTPAHVECLRYLGEAMRVIARPAPWLVLMCGVSGAGKSTVAAELAACGGAIRLRADAERKRLFGLAPEASSREVVDIYTADAGQRTFARLAELARTTLAAGLPVVIDATFIRRARRDEFRALAAACGVPCHVVLCTAAPEELRARVNARQARGGDPSEADAAVLESQLRDAELPDPAREPDVVSASVGVAAILARLRPPTP